MLKVELDKKSRTVNIWEIPTGTVFYGSIVSESNEIVPRLKLTGLGVVNLNTFQVITGVTKTTPIFNYEVIPDAILTTRNRIDMDNTIRNNSLLDSYFPDLKKSMDTKETD